MYFFRKFRRSIAKSVSLMMLISAFMPAISHAIAKTQGITVPLSKVCTSSGVKLISFVLNVDTEQADINKSTNLSIIDSNQPKNQESSIMVDCAFCATHMQSFIFVKFDAPNFLSNLRAITLPPLFYAAPHSNFVWRAPQTRAPPYSS